MTINDVTDVLRLEIEATGEALLRVRGNRANYWGELDESLRGGLVALTKVAEKLDMEALAEKGKRILAEAANAKGGEA
jgi:hypothetical protein